MQHIESFNPVCCHRPGKMNFKEKRKIYQIIQICLQIDVRDKFTIIYLRFGLLKSNFYTITTNSIHGSDDWPAAS
jgi:hypothetical protein